MSKTITGEKLKKLVQDGIVIEKGDINNCGPLKYDFVLSDDFLKAEFRSPQEISSLTASEKKNVIIEPGEVVYVLTKESVNIPDNMYMQLSANRGMSEYGVLTLGGFAVDPGYSGRLMFGLYNYSSTPFVLIPGKKLVGAVFYELDATEAAAIKDVQAPKSITQFPPQLISTIGQYSPTGVNALEESIKQIREQIEAHRKEININRDELAELRRLSENAQHQIIKFSESMTDMKDTVASLSKSTNNLKKALEDESAMRKQISDDVDRQISEFNGKLEQKIQFLKGATWVATAIVGAIGTLFITWLLGWLNIG